MITMGIDHHKKYSYVVAMDSQNKVLWEGKMSNQKESFQSLKESLPENEPVQSVLEAGRNWGILFDLLDSLEMNPHLANPYKSRLIAETYKKTDKLDAHTQAWMLNAGITPLVHVPSHEIRKQKNILRQRLWLVRTKTAIKNRIHNIIDRNHFEAPKGTDLFSSTGLAWIRALRLCEPDQKLLESNLYLLNTVESLAKDTERWIYDSVRFNPMIPILQSFPGIGQFLSTLIALELCSIERFASEKKLCAYAGLANSTYSSGGKTYHGGLIRTCNHHLRYAFIEAAWTAVRVSPYFRAFFSRLKARKGSHVAIGATARKLCEIAYHCLKNKRCYQERSYKAQFQSGRPAIFSACC